MTPRLALVSSLAAVALTPAAAQAGAIHSGTITVNRGINGATLGMSRDQVIDRLGRPVDENANGVMDYTDPIKGPDIFELFRGGSADRVQSFQLDLHGRKFKLADGNAVYAKGGLGRLFDHYGTRLHRQKEFQGQKSYILYGSKFRGRKVATNFLVTRYARSGRVYEVNVFFRR